ncbi:MAG: FliI/YscN family ATPase [Spartobacteria bacterium]|nr:FliI/YscN family ATPase [Spartobacteria bacterium]
MELKPNLRLEEALTGMREMTFVRPEGRVVEVTGLTVKAIGPPVSIGDMTLLECESPRGIVRIPSEVVGFQGQHVLVMPYGDLAGIRPGARVIPAGRLTVRAGYSMLGRVLDGLGQPIDGKPAPWNTEAVEIERDAPPAMLRNPLSEVFATGIRAIDGVLTMAKGQRIGIMAGSGVGKSVLLGSLARNSVSTVNVIALIGERGREVRDFIEKNLGPEGMEQSVVVVVTSDKSPMERMKGAFTAMAVAEYFRDKGEDVLFLMDSVTRCAMAKREVGLAIGEPPTTKGYPPSVFSFLARLLERSGASEKGSITALYTVLVEGDDINDPIGDTVRSIVDGHIVLSRKLASLNHYPAIDLKVSVSRVMSDVASLKHKDLAGKLRSVLSVYEKAEDLINIGAYSKGANPKIDEAIARIDGINRFLCQRPEEAIGFEDTLKQLEVALR